MHKILVYLHTSIIHLLKSSTCFEHYPAHLQEVCVVIVYMQPLVSSLSAGDCPVHRLRTGWRVGDQTKVTVLFVSQSDVFSSAMIMISAFSGDFTQQSMVVPYRRFGTTYRAYLQGSSIPKRMVTCSVKVGPMDCSGATVLRCV
jgi:hypothetical protein